MYMQRIFSLLNIPRISLQRLNVCKISTSCSLRNITSKYQANAVFPKTPMDKYWDVPLPECICQANYLWIDGTGEKMRSKTRTLDFIPKCVQEVPIWNYDGCSTYQAEANDPEVYLCPRAMYEDPIRRGNNKIVLCDTYTCDHKPTKTNNRASFVEALDCVADEEPWFGVEQEYVLLDVDGRPFGWPSFGFPAPPGPYFCGVGSKNIICRELVEAHYRCCLYAGIQIGGTNAEVMPAQWEFQIGPGIGIKCADDLWTARFLLNRLSEEFGCIVTFRPKPVKDWNGSEAHTNFSTKKTRKEGGLKEIEKCIDKLSKKHKHHLKKYGRKDEKESEKFTSGVGSRNVSVRIPRATFECKKGYFEDRRPPANCDPYKVCEALIRTCYID